MKKTKEKMNNTIINNLNVETIETTPEDGFVKGKEIRPLRIQHYGKGNTQYYKGYAKTVSYTTNDPRITRPIAYGMFGIFLVIGLLLVLLAGELFYGIIFIGIAVFGFIKSKKDIDKIADKLKSQGHGVTVDSEEEKEQLKN